MSNVGIEVGSAFPYNVTTAREVKQYKGMSKLEFVSAILLSG